MTFRAFEKRLTWSMIVTVGALVAYVHAAMAETATDQITVVIPAVQAGTSDLDKADAALIPYILGQSIKRYFERRPGMHRSALVMVPAPLPDNRLSSLSTLAKINGAQIAVLMKAFRQFNGALINTVMVIPESYQDFRTERFETLKLTFDDAELALDVPGRYVVFPSLFLDADILSTYKSGKYRDICPVGRCDSDVAPKVTGACLRLGSDVSYGETIRYVSMARTSAILKFNGVCYLQSLPANGPISQPVVDFIAGVQRFFVGDWVVARDRMLAVVGVAGLKSDLKLMAYLYLARISLRQEDDSGAQRFLGLASAINERDPDVLKTRYFLSFWRAVRSARSGVSDRGLLVRQVGEEMAKLPPPIQQPYLPLLNALKKRI